MELIVWLCVVALAILFLWMYSIDRDISRLVRSTRGLNAAIANINDILEKKK